MKTKKLPNPTE